MEKGGSQDAEKCWQMVRMEGGNARYRTGRVTEML